jgi:hypothetical protein
MLPNDLRVSSCDLNPAALARRRRLTEARLARLVQEANLDIPISAITSAIAGYHHTRFQVYLADFAATFATTQYRINEDRLLSVLEDAWNYFPHKSLRGCSPAEILADQPR